jgi:hypothetical protein
MKIRRSLGMFLLLGCVLMAPQNLPSCGPFANRPIFVGSSAPLEPMASFAAGRLGVVQPSWQQVYLMVAYRYLSGNPLTELQQRSFVSLFNNQPAETVVFSSSQSKPTAVQTWLNERAEVARSGETPDVRTFRKVRSSDWESYLNCTDDAFRNAAATLDRRIGQYGAADPRIKEWVTAQDNVFSNCSGGETIPPPPDPSLPPILRADREYQIAAAQFYSEHYDQAAGLFRKIASDKASPWNAMAPYLVARCFIRKATVLAPPFKTNDEDLSKAGSALQSLLRDEAQAGLHSAARLLLNFVMLRLHPLDRMKTLARQIQSRESGGAFGQDLTDYRYLFEHAWRFPELKPDSLQHSDDMTDWIQSMKIPGGAPHCLERWKETGSAAWLIATMIKLAPRDPEMQSVIRAGFQISRDSPAYPTAAYHRFRLLTNSEETDLAREELDSALPDLRTRMPASSYNLFLAERMSLSRNLDEFVRFAPREIAGRIDFETGKDYPIDEKQRELFFDDDSLKVFNEGMPISMLRRAAGNPSLPARLRRQLFAAAWVRAVLASDLNFARSLTSDMERNFQDLRPELQSFLSAQGAEASRFAATLLMLKFPGLSPLLKRDIADRKAMSGIDKLRENWWCSFMAPGKLDDMNFGRYIPFGIQVQQQTPSRVPEFPGFMKQTEKSAFEREWKELAGVGAGPDFLGRVVLQWARKHPGDERNPEALYLVVKATRFGCNDAETWRYSRDAFRLLHIRYADTPWAKMTPYWFR